MDRDKAFVLWFDELRRADVALVGGKSSSLGELTSQTKVPVPYGFATTAEGYRHFMHATGLDTTIKELLKGLTDVEDPVQLRDVTASIRKAICDADMPQDLADSIRTSYEELGRKMGVSDPFVAVRSSATAEDLPDASFAGQQDTYLNVKGADMVIQKVKECYASTFTDRATYYRTKQGFDHLSVALSAAVQMMVFSKAAGVMFTVDLVTGDDSTITIEGAWGLGEYVVQGTVTPDNFRVRKDDLSIISKMINTKPVKLVRKDTGDVEEQAVPEDQQKQPAITDEQVKELAGYAKAIEKHYGCYMDMEWGVDERTNKIWLLQARPETVWSKKNKEKKSASAESGVSAAMTKDRVTIVKGLPASPGHAAGKAHVILDPSKIEEFKDGEILVTTMTAPDWVPAMKKAKAIVTDAGGMTCHASIVSRELGIPCIVGTKSRDQEATTTIQDGQEITVDATNRIYEGIVEDIVKCSAFARPAQVPPSLPAAPVTGTKIYESGQSRSGRKIRRPPCDGIGLMRGEEFIWTTFIHEHPLYLIEIGHRTRREPAGRRHAQGLPGPGSRPVVAFQRFQIERIPQPQRRRQIRTPGKQRSPRLARCVPLL